MANIQDGGLHHYADIHLDNYFSTWSFLSNNINIQHIQKAVGFDLIFPAKHNNNGYKLESSVDAAVPEDGTR